MCTKKYRFIEQVNIEMEHSTYGRYYGALLNEVNSNPEFFNVNLSYR
jgi:hypothetical protein